MSAFEKFLDWTGRRIANRVTLEPDPSDVPLHTDIALMQRVMRPGDVLLIDGRDKLSAAIRYLTQSRWSHAALYIGDKALSQQGEGEETGQSHTLIEVNLAEGCVDVPLSKYRHYPTRICRAVHLTDADRESIIAYMQANLGAQYDTRNVFDLVRYLVPKPPVPRRWRRRMLALGSGSPTRAICSTLIAEAFQAVKYPILPRIEKLERGERGSDGYTAADILHIRHHSLFTPSDFDVSPYFEIIKPTIAEGFNYKGLTWAPQAPETKQSAVEDEPKPALGDENSA